MKNLFLVLFYIIIYFGMVTMLGKYESYYSYNLIEYISFVLLCIALIFLFFKRNIVLSKLILIIFFIGANYYFGNFIINLLFPPTIPALNCNGALPMNGNWVRGIIFTLLTSPFFIFLYYKTMKKVNYFEKIYVLLGVLLLLTLFIIPNSFIAFNQFILSKGKPTVIYPEGC